MLRNASDSERCARGDRPPVDAVIGWMPRHASVLDLVWPDLQRGLCPRPDVLERQLRHVPRCPDLLLLPPDLPVDGKREPEREPAQHQHPGVSVLLSASRGMRKGHGFAGNERQVLGWRENLRRALGLRTRTTKKGSSMIFFTADRPSPLTIRF